jgi:hypothetical protein
MIGTQRIQYPKVMRFIRYLVFPGNFNVSIPQMYPMITVQKYAGIASSTAINGCPPGKWKYMRVRKVILC